MAVPPDTRRQIPYGRFLLTMIVTVWLARSLFGNTWLAVAVALAVNLIISWPRHPKAPKQN